MTTDEAAQQRLREAKARLLETLSGQKQNTVPDRLQPIDGYKMMAEQIKLNQAKREMIRTLSQGRKDDGYDDGTIVAEYPAQELHKQAALKAELRQRLAGQTRKAIQKQNQCPLATGSTGIRSVVEDSNATNTPSGVPFVGKGYITARNGTITLDSILQDEMESADEDSPSPAVTSGRDGTSDWSPRDHQDVEYDGDDDDEKYDPAEQTAKILSMYTGSDGRVRKHASAHFLTVSGDGSQASMYAIPLSRMDDVSQTILYDIDALDEAFAIAAGRDSGLANYGKMSRIVRIKQRNHMPLNESQQDHRIRHMAAVPPSDEEYNAAATGRTT